MIRWMYRAERIALFGLAFAVATAAFAESLWEPTFDGYISGSSTIAVGETLVIVLDTKIGLSYKASYIDSKHIQIELSGGDGGNLMNFLPAGVSSTNETLTGRNEIDLDASVAVRVLQIDETGSLVVSGSRTINLDGISERIVVSGIVDPDLIGDGHMVPTSSVADLTLVYTGLLESSSQVFRSEDLIQKNVTPAVANEPVTTGAGATETLEAETTSTDTSADAATETPSVTPQAAEQLELSQEKREELLLYYLNRLLGLIFRAQ